MNEYRFRVATQVPVHVNVFSVISMCYGAPLYNALLIQKPLTTHSAMHWPRTREALIILLRGVLKMISQHVQDIKSAIIVSYYKTKIKHCFYNIHNIQHSTKKKYLK